MWNRACPALFDEQSILPEATEYDDDSYEAVTCLACRRVHLVNPKTGTVLGEDDDK
ncbi:MAG TPA: hypothetical protein VMF32_11245 [Xanthobacteraceae bacterium]|nr:hypothetical protein [Xanthobacteraceae bacterium]